MSKHPPASPEAIRSAGECFGAILADPGRRAEIAAYLAAHPEQPVSGDDVVPPGRVETDQAVA